MSDVSIDYIRRIVPATETYFMVPAISWTPADLGTALILWLKADTGLSLSGSNVTAWADQSGNGNDVSEGTNFPTYNATGFNGYPTVTFANPSGLTTAVDSVANLGNTSSWYYVGTFNTAVNASARALTFLKNITIGNETDGGALSLLAHTAAFSNDYFVNGPASFQNGSFFGPPTPTQLCATGTTNQRIGITLDNSNLTLYVGNVQGFQGALVLTLGSPGTIRLGAGLSATGLGTVDATTTACWAGSISEVVVTNTALSAGDRSSLDSYFQIKWGL